MDEDSTFVLEKNQETNEMLLSGLGEMQLEILNRKVKNKFELKHYCKLQEFHIEKQLKGG